MVRIWRILWLSLQFIAILQVDIVPKDLKACHPPGKGSNRTSIVAKFIDNDQKDRVWARTRLLKNYKNPQNSNPVFINYRLTKHDTLLKQAAEQENLYVSTKNSQPFFQIVQNGMRMFQVINTIKDIEEL